MRAQPRPTPRLHAQRLTSPSSSFTVDSEREHRTDRQGSTLLREIKASGKPVQELPEDWVARLSLTEAKAQAA